MGRMGIAEILILLGIATVILIPFLCYRAGKKRGFELGKNIGFKEGLEFNKTN